MSKKLTALCAILALLLALAPAALAGSNTDTLADWDITVAVPDGKTAMLKGGEYYIYIEEGGGIPYVMLRAYRYDSAEGFLAEFTDYMRGQYDDLRVTQEPTPVRIGDKNGLETFYAYKVSGYDVTDRRVAIRNGERVYMFASKEIEALGKTVGDMLDEVVANCVFLSPPAETPPAQKETVRSVGYLYCLPNGMPKYFVDFSGLASDNLLLHCWFRSSDPSFYESIYALHLDEAQQTKNGALFPRVTGARDFDCSHFFKSLRLAFDGDELVMQVERDEKTLAGGSEDNILTGEYRMKPVDVGYVYQYRTENGRLKYWLDLDGEDIALHALFVSGDPEPYEQVFTLDGEYARRDGDSIVFRSIKVGDFDVSDWFRDLRLTVTDGGVEMDVVRDESTLAGGAGDNIMTGRYLFTPRTFFLPPSEGPYTGEELARFAQTSYFIRTGFYPPEAEAVKNADGSYTVHLYEIVTLDGVSHTATSAWYTVDEYGLGADDITGEKVSLILSSADRIG